MTKPTNRDITPLIGILGSAGEPSHIASDKHKMIDEAFGEDFDIRRRERSDLVDD